MVLETSRYHRCFGATARPPAPQQGRSRQRKHLRPSTWENLTPFRRHPSLLQVPLARVITVLPRNNSLSVEHPSMMRKTMFI